MFQRRAVSLAAAALAFAFSTWVPRAWPQAFGTQSAPTDETPTELVARLAGMAPVLDSRHAPVTSFEVRGALAPYGFHCFYDGLNNQACIVRYHDTPIFLGVGQSALLYNPLDGVRLFDGEWSVGVEASGTQLHLRLYLHPPGNDHGITIDLRSLVANAPHRRSVQVLDKKHFVLTGFSDQGSALQAWIEPDRPVPITRVRVVGESVVLFDLERLAINERMSSDLFRFPPLPATLPVGPPTRVSLGNREALRVIFRSLFLQAGLADPTERSEIETSLDEHVDWDDLQHRDATLAPVLRGLVDDYEQAGVR